MPTPRSAAASLALVACLAAAAGCARPATRAAFAEIGHHRVRWTTPKGWEALDHGKQRLFRFAEAQISLVDMGPATAEAMIAELKAAERLWRDGRREDAFSRVRSLRSPVLRFATSDQRLDFWRPWHNVTYVPSRAQDYEIGPAFEALIAGATDLPPVSPALMLEYVLTALENRGRRVVARREPRLVHDSRWVVVEMWDPTTHLNRSRLAFLVNDGCLLVLAMDRGVYEQAGPAFDELLASLEVERPKAAKP